ncbi:MAG: UPF0758 domain-containing protein, partial [Actinomycetota bacterium]
MSDAELLALVLRTGASGEDVLEFASRVLSALGGLGTISRLNASELVAVPGIGPATAAEIVAALELGRRAAQRLAAERPQILRPADAAALLSPRLAHLEQERCLALLLDRRHRLLREVLVGVGG